MTFYSYTCVTTSCDIYFLWSNISPIENENDVIVFMPEPVLSDSVKPQENIDISIVIPINHYSYTLVMPLDTRIQGSGETIEKY